MAVLVLFDFDALPISLGTFRLSRQFHEAEASCLARLFYEVYENTMIELNIGAENIAGRLH